MIRSEIIRDIAPVLCDQLVVCNIGLPSQELHLIDDQASNFYMLGTMGLSSSIGLGLALSQEKMVISIDGDGSILTNLGTLPTIANNVADNYILLIIDNGSMDLLEIKRHMLARKHRLRQLRVLVDVKM